MRRAVLPLAAAVLLVGPTVIAFFSGGYFVGARLVGAGLAWTAVLVAAIAVPQPLPRSRAGWAAVAGLALMTAWSAASLAWAPLGGPALADVERLVLYTGVLIAAIAWLRTPEAARWVEPVLALGTAVVIGYGLAGRLLPGVLTLAHSQHAGPRLEQPLTYWNAEGALAAIGLVLCAHLAGDRTRPARMRALAAGVAPGLGVGIWLSYSRGAIAALVVGLLVLLAAAPTRPQLRAAATALTGAVLASAASAAFPAVADLQGTPAVRERDGAIVLAVLGVISIAAWWLTARQVPRERTGELPGARRLPLAAALAVVLALAGVVAGGLAERGNGATLANRQGAGRLTTTESNRYEYWRIGIRAFADHPLDGLGAGGFRVVWLRERPISEGVVDVHSLELEMACELGLPGLLALGLLVGGVATAARRAVSARSLQAGGWCAGCAVYLVHASIDWDWQMPGVTLPALLLAGTLIAAVERPAAQPALAPSEPAVPAQAGVDAGVPT